MTGSPKESRKNGLSPRAAGDGDSRPSRREAEFAPDSPGSGTIRVRTPADAHIAHALDIALVQLQNVEDLLADDEHCAGAQMAALRAIVVRLEERLSKAGR